MYDIRSQNHRNVEKTHMLQNTWSSCGGVIYLSQDSPSVLMRVRSDGELIPGSFPASFSRHALLRLNTVICPLKLLIEKLSNIKHWICWVTVSSLSTRTSSYTFQTGFLNFIIFDKGFIDFEGKKLEKRKKWKVLREPITYCKREEYPLPSLHLEHECASRR
jgi:hypothetical protein